MSQEHPVTHTQPSLWRKEESVQETGWVRQGCEGVQLTTHRTQRPTCLLPISGSHSDLEGGCMAGWAGRWLVKQHPKERPSLGVSGEIGQLGEHPSTPFPTPKEALRGPSQKPPSQPRLGASRREGQMAGRPFPGKVWMWAGSPPQQFGGAPRGGAASLEPRSCSSGGRTSAPAAASGTRASPP